MDLHFTELEKIMFLQRKGYKIREVGGYIQGYATTDYHGIDSGFIDAKMRFAYPPSDEGWFNQMVEKEQGNLRNIEMTYGLDRIFQDEFRQSLLNKL